MSKKRPSAAEARWRANYRYRRMDAAWRKEEAIGDPTGLVAKLRAFGAFEFLHRAIVATTHPGIARRD